MNTPYNKYTHTHTHTYQTTDLINISEHSTLTSYHRLQHHL